MATSSVNELVDAVKKPSRPRALSESANRPFIRKSSDGGIGGQQQEKSDGLVSLNLENKAPARRHSHAGTRSTSMERISELPETKSKKSRRLSFMG